MELSYLAGDRVDHASTSVQADSVDYIDKLHPYMSSVKCPFDVAVSMLYLEVFGTLR
jgi:hypothetical protein